MSIGAAPVQTGGSTSGGSTPTPTPPQVIVIQGEQGEQGDRGAPGADGAQGTQGIQGIQGRPGDPGPQGEQGEQGDPGPPGTPGVNGAQGTQGVQGLQGIPGAPGDPGEDGEPGPPGATGPQGIQGTPGLQGAQGVMGPPGWDADEPEPFTFAGIPTLTKANLPLPLDHHADLTNFTANDDHTQYTRLAGRAGTANDTILTTTAAGTGTLSGSSTASGSLALKGSTDAGVTSSIVLEPHWTNVGNNNMAVISFDPALVFDNASSRLIGVEIGSVKGAQTQWLVTANLINTQFAFFYDPNVINSPSGTGRTLGSWTPYSHAPQFNHTGAGTSVVTSSIAFIDQGGTAAAGGGTINTTLWTTTKSAPVLNGGTVTDRKGFHHAVNGGTATITNDVAVDVDAIAATGVTAALRSAIAAATGRFFLQDNGGAQSAFAGIFTKYNNQTLVKLGVAHQIAFIDLTVQGAALAAQNLFTAPATGFYRVSWYASVTRAATTSSTLGGAKGFQLAFSDGDGGGLKLSPQVGVPPSGTVAGTNQTYSQTNQANTTAAMVSGVICIFVINGNAVTYNFDYTSAGGTNMQYNLHIRVEAM